MRGESSTCLLWIELIRMSNSGSFYLKLFWEGQDSFEVDQGKGKEQDTPWSQEKLEERNCTTCRRLRAQDHYFQVSKEPLENRMTDLSLGDHKERDFSTP